MPNKSFFLKKFVALNKHFLIINTKKNGGIMTEIWRLLIFSFIQ